MAKIRDVENYRETNIVQQVVNVKPVRLVLPAAHPQQYKLITACDTIPGVRFVVGACGSKWGKTMGCSIAMVKKAWDLQDSLNWWIAPAYSQATNAMNLIQQLLPDGTYRPYSDPLRLELLTPSGKTRSTIVFKSADNPDTLRGFGVHFFVMDEAARCPYESYVSVMTTVTQTRGKGLFISTPNKRGWFYDIYQWGSKFREEHPEWYSIRMPTWMNPHVPKESLQEAKRNMPEEWFRQEYGAEFIDDSAGVFRGIKECVSGEFQEPELGHQYVMGVDLARINDYTVLTVMDRKTLHVVHFERFNQVEWEVQYKRIIDTAKKYRALVVMDSSGLGDPIVATISGAGIRVVPYKIGTNAAKKQLIDKLRVNIEKKKVTFPNIGVLKGELENYEYSITDAGVVRFSAPSGQHDDTVISLALANWGADQAPFVYKYSNQRGI